MPIVIHNVKVGLTGPRRDVRVDGGRVTAVGDLDRAGVDVYEFPDAMVLPGLRDGHLHSTQWATMRRRLDLRGTRSAREAAEAVRARAEAVVEDIVVGYGFRDGLWADQPHTELLAEAAPGRAVMLLSNDLHTAWLSPAALAKVGRGNHPTGLLREGDAVDAAASLGGVLPGLADDWVLQAAQEAASRGVTAIRDFEVADNIGDWSRRCARARLPVRVECAVYPSHRDDAQMAARRTGDVVAGTEGMVTVGPFKLFVDGSLGTRTALCHDPYPDAARVADAHGLELLPPAALRAAMRDAWSIGLQPAVHAIGDRACRQAIDAFEEVGCPGRIEHAQLIQLADVDRLARLDIIVGVQPAHCPDDRDVAEVAWPSRTARAFAYADMIARGVRIEFGSDAPVAPLDPWDGIASAVSRTDDERPPWHPEQAISLAEALAASCGGSTTVATGQPADLVVVPADLSDRDAAALRVTPVLATMVGGRWTHRSQ